jgi:hypothetical protein
MKEYLSLEDQKRNAAATHAPITCNHVPRLMISHKYLALDKLARLGLAKS